jgi:hypothetical protein
MPHSPNGRNLRAVDVAVLPDSPVDLISAISIDGTFVRRHGVVQTAATRHILLRLCGIRRVNP